MILSVLERALALAFGRIGTLLAASWGYILLMAGLNLALSGQFLPGDGFTTVSYLTEPVAAADDGAVRVLAGLANVLLGFAAATAYMRRILIDARDFPFSFAPRVLKVMMKLLLLLLLGGLLMIPLLAVAGAITAITAGFGIIAFLATPFVALMLVQKLSLILPAAALEDRLSLRQSWSASAGLGWPMALAALVMGLLSVVITLAWIWVLGLVKAAVPDATTALAVSAALPLGSVGVSVWLFASLHATCYGLVRERYAERVGLTPGITDAARTRHEAAAAIARVRNIGKS
ncbi:4-hydroxy-3-methylbut-2-en-1-yl diphosphate synthase [Microvirga tunisiensis]|uniref:4-hydroxy-3-methylbut-2-en-1-yl diphosphate synthase n=1 Tax=Pannonibacter tanglangensis TaxID=2750084 RepID=A0A7X5JAS9_9HYPH|nr:4-hydroxy-3-methylbut-2-en-1-yl diphosphate synthase [Pannonibacter sp. XCT-53]NBN80382.1 4-hydroxy-3-methylbut-2-en-1-yl diphosphate synthase [Pannonibacter sp. XCT-53]